MADFTVVAARGLQVVAWEDPRNNPHPGVPLRAWQAFAGDLIELHAQVAGVDAPPDADLDGRLFSVDLVEGPTRPTWILCDRSAIARLRFNWCGHYVIAFRRVGGGAELVPVDVVSGVTT